MKKLLRLLSIRDGILKYHVLNGLCNVQEMVEKKCASAAESLLRGRQHDQALLVSDMLSIGDSEKIEGLKVLHGNCSIEALKSLPPANLAGIYRFYSI